MLLHLLLASEYVDKIMSGGKSMMLVIGVTVIGVVIVCLVIVIAKALMAPKKAEGVRKLIRQGKIDQAIKLARSILSRDPKDFVVHYYLARAYIVAKRFTEALSEYDMINDNALFEPPLAEVPFRKEFAELLVRMNKKNDAINQQLLLTKLDGQNPVHLFNLGKLENDCGKKEDALKHLLTCEKMNTHNPKLHALLGDIYFQMKKPKDAKYELDQAIKMDPNEYSCYYYLGKVLKEEKDTAEAVKAFDKAQRDPEYKERALIERGSCYVTAGRFDNAQIDFQRAIECDKDGSKNETLYARYFLANCYEKDHKLDKAVEQWKLIKKRNPKFKDVSAKLDEYEGLAANDNMKDFLTCSDAEFLQMCKTKCMTALKLAAQDVRAAKEGCVAVATEAGEGDWRSARKQVVYVRFFRGVDSVEDSLVRDTLDAAKKASCSKSIFLSSAGFTPAATKAAEGRPIELIDKAKIEKLLG